MDERLQGLRRSDDPIARATLLRQQVRAGSLDEARVGLAAYLGDPAARALLLPTVPRPQPRNLVGRSQHRSQVTLYRVVRGRHVAFQLWANRLAEWGHEVRVRAALAASRLAVDEARGDYWSSDRDGAGPVGEAIESAEQWVVHPCEPCRPRCQEANRGFGQYLFHLLYSIAHWQGGRNGAAKASAVEAIKLAALALTEARVKLVVAAELVPWALGERDPVAERVQSRG